MDYKYSKLFFPISQCNLTLTMAIQVKEQTVQAVKIALFALPPLYPYIKPVPGYTHRTCWKILVDFSSHQTLNLTRTQKTLCSTLVQQTPAETLLHARVTEAKVREIPHGSIGKKDCQVFVTGSHRRGGVAWKGVGWAVWDFLKNEEPEGTRRAGTREGKISRRKMFGEVGNGVGELNANLLG